MDKSNAYTDIGYADPELIDKVKKKVVTLGLSEDLLEKLWKKDDDKVVGRWVLPENTAFKYLYVILEKGRNGDYELFVQTKPLFSGRSAKLFIYFFKEDSNCDLTADKFDDLVCYGCIPENKVLDCLLEIVHKKFGPKLLNKQTWPDSIKKEFSSQIHKFLGSLTETTYRMKGSTVLYIPNENITNIAQARKQKDIVQRLETALINWTSQIKEVVHEKDFLDQSDELKPLAEIRYWRSRTKDLQKLKDQINSEQVQNILEVLKNSSYLKSFTKLAGEIQKGFEDSKDNLKFLSTLIRECEILERSKPSDIKHIIPDILKKVILIWNLSSNYYSTERITGFLKRISNQIIEQCTKYIDIHHVFEGDINVGKEMLMECIEAGVKWKEICLKTFIHLKKSKNELPNKRRKFSYDHSSVFAEIDAFVHRCRDLIEVCDAQFQMGSIRSLPVIGGSKGGDIVNSLLDIRGKFGKLLSSLKAITYDVLNVKSTQWHDDYSKFKNGVRDLELIMVNVLTSSFEMIRTVEDGAELLESFSSLATRKHLKNVIQLKTSDLYSFFTKEMEKVQTIFETNNKNPPICSFHPRYSGSAIWALKLKKRLSKEKKAIDRISFLDSPSLQKEKRSLGIRFEHLYNNILTYFIRQCNEEWKKSLDYDELKRMELLPLLRRGTNGLVQLNFHPKLISTYREFYYWQKITGFEPPIKLIDIMGDIPEKEELFRVYMENVNEVVRFYNSILQTIEKEGNTTIEGVEGGEKINILDNLFKERVRNLDKKISHGLNSLYWNNQKGIDYFVEDCLITCKKIIREIERFIEVRYKIVQKCQEISTMLLIEINNKEVYTRKNFIEVQKQHKKKVKLILMDINEEIIGMMKSIYDIFKKDPEDIHESWWKFAKSIENRIDKALRTSLKVSFNTLSEAINGDPNLVETNNPLFFVNVELSDSGSTEKRVPVLVPSMEELEKLIETTQREMTKCLQVVTCLVPSLKELIIIEDREDEFGRMTNEEKQKMIRRKKISDYSEFIKDDKSFREPMASAYRGIKRVDDDVKKHLEEGWTKQFERLWRSDRDVITKRLMYKNKPSVIFEQEYQKYSYYHAGVRKKPHTKVIGYLQLDFSHLKNQTSEEAELMMRTVLDVLHKQAKKSLDEELYKINTNMRLLKEEISNRHILKGKISLLEKCKKDIYRDGDENLKKGEVNKNLSNLEKRFVPINQRYTVLKKYALKKHEKKALLKNDELSKLDDFERLSREYEDTIRFSENKISSLKENFKIELRKQITSYEEGLGNLLTELKDRGPYTTNYSVAKAQSIIEEFSKKLEKMKKEQAGLLEGTKMFGIAVKKYRETKEISKQIERLEKVWGLKRKWNKTINEWKNQVFQNLDTDEMKVIVADYIKNVNLLSRDCEEWGIWKILQNDLFRFKNTLPLLMDLKNKAMRPRHWDELYKVIPIKFNHLSSDFNMEKIMKMKFDSYAEDIRAISNKARQELNIENALKKIENSWKNMKIEINPFREKYFKVGEVEEIFQQLDDDSATLSVMKLNSFIKTFLSDTTQWEKTLTSISEILEILMQLQETWLYLLNIFEVEDISKQLPTETVTFREVNRDWRIVLKRIKLGKGVLKSLSREGLKEDLVDMLSQLEGIQKQLDDYLEIKRQEFPRFYFLSDRDLLEILGHSRNHNAVQHHLQNCFDGIHSIKIEEAYDSKTKSKQAVARGFYSKEGEYMQLSKNVILSGRVEKWLNELEKAMKQSVKKHLKTTYQDASGKKERELWVKSSLGQLLILSAQIYWTKRVEDIFKKMSSGKGTKKNLKDLSRRTWDRYLKKYSKMIRKDLDPLTRQKLIALITIEVHQKDVIESLFKSGVTGKDQFDWEKQLRFYFDQDTVKIKQTSAVIEYDYEYIGPSPRLVITPLTERCYMTLTTAVHLSRGGNPKGPAGTGKTETVKDLAKTIGKFCIVFNCSKGLDINSMARMFSGLVQTGAWSCFDEFNRIDIEVLSVVAQQIGLIIEAIIKKVSNFQFDGKEITLKHSCGIFCTMNPGYAGRSELPDNLKALLRPIAMMRPDSSRICEIFLYSQGFNESRKLSKKIVTLYDLMKQQLSKQKHYDFGLRAIKAVLTNAGELKREIGDKVDEQTVLYQACKDMNIPKFVADDLPLFEALLGDLFPNVEPYEKDLDLLKQNISNALVSQGLEEHSYIIQKSVELYETKRTRHGVMVVGKTCSGKTTTWKTLKLGMNLIAKQKKSKPTVETFLINPKALSNSELYGYYTKSRDWKNGVLSVIMKNACKQEKGKKNNEKWIAFDGPVDTLWIESMNTVLDDTKTLTLISGERIRLSKNVSLLFEVKDLSVASPATVSRCGMVFFDETKLGWETLYSRWMKKRLSKIEREDMKKFENLYQSTFFSFIKRSLFTKKKCTELVHTADINLVRSLFRLFDSLDNEEYGLNQKDAQYPQLLTKFFIFSLIWSIGATVNEDQRNKMDMLFREFDPHFPSKETVYEYYIDEKTKNWRLWSERIQKNWKPSSKKEYFNILVPTVDTTRNMFVLKALVSNQKNVLVIGNVGTGKTSIIKNLLYSVNNDFYSHCTINFSSGTTSQKLQKIIESRLERKSVDTIAPISGKRLILFVDDFNMPGKDKFGSQPPLELLRQFIDNKSWYDRSNQSLKKIHNVQIISAMGPPGGGREEISTRLMSRFNIINVTLPKDIELHRIYTSLLKHRLDELDELKSILENIVDSTIEVFKFVTQTFRPTPNKSHYVFNLRDLSKVFQGILKADHENMDSIQQFERLWVHECFRVFHDRLNDNEDRVLFKETLKQKLITVFGTKWSTLFPRRKDIIPFGNILFESYHEMSNEKKLSDHIKNQLHYYNNEIGAKEMKLVLFSEAIDHITRISRIINFPQGNALLIGVGGSGRSSLTRLAAYLNQYEVFEIEISDNYGIRDFHESLKDLFRKCGIDGKKVVFLIKDTQFVEDYFLEDINNMLSSGEVPNLFEDEEVDEIYDLIRSEALSNGVDEVKANVYGFFLDKVKKYLRVVVCMSPVGEEFRRRIRMFPALVNCTTIDWFDDWPESALKEVAYNFLKNVNFDDIEFNPKNTKPIKKKEFEEEKKEDIKEHIAEIFVEVHNSVRKQSKKLFKELKRFNYVTPTNYLELVTGYISLLKEKRDFIGKSAGKLEQGVRILEKARESVLTMKVSLAQQKEEVAIRDAECENLMNQIMKEQQELNAKKEQVNTKQAQIKQRRKKLERVEHEAARELEKVQPELDKAIALVNAIDTNDILELRGYITPPKNVEMVLVAVMVCLNKKSSYEEAKTQMVKPAKFISMISNYKHENMSNKLLAKIKKMTSQPKFKPEIVRNSSAAIADLCQWVIASENYGRVWKFVKPKKDKLESARASLNEELERLKESEMELQELNENLSVLEDELEKKREEKMSYVKMKENTEKKLSLSKKLVNGLKSEKERWTRSIAEFKEQIQNLPGDVLMAAAFLGYAGPFTSEHRDELERFWEREVRKHFIPHSKHFNMKGFLIMEVELQSWILQGLPSDSFSQENGALVKRGRRWPLMIDPQGQANKWIKNLEKENGIEVTDFKKDNFLRNLENAIVYGRPVLIQDVGEDIDPSLDSIIGKETYKKGNQIVIKLGDKELDFNPNFRLYMTTKLPNPHFKPEISTKTTIVNFSVTKGGLEEQLLVTVVKMENPDLENQKKEIVSSVAAGKKTMVELEDSILHQITTASDLLNEKIIKTLQRSKKNSEEIKEKLLKNKKTEQKIDLLRDTYREAAIRASILYFVLCDLSVLDPMYQFSLETYIELFEHSISNSEKPRQKDDVEKRVSLLNDYHTYEVYKSTCQALFEKDKLLFSFHLCAKIELEKGLLDPDEYSFFLRGGVVMDKESQMINPCSEWLPESCWDNFFELDKLVNFHELVSNLEENSEEWYVWYKSPNPEETMLPTEWQSKCSFWERMLLVRCCREDRLLTMIKQFVTTRMKSDLFVRPPTTDVSSVYKGSSPFTPFIFILSSGVDPIQKIEKLARRERIRLHSLSLGQNQEKKATQLIREAVSLGEWVYLANCHLMMSWMPHLEKLIEELSDYNPSDKFRLWLSSKPHKKFSISILQKSRKITLEPSTGIQNNMIRLIGEITKKQYEGFTIPFKKCLYSLMFYHSVLLERKKFGNLGWNKLYDFNDSDFLISLDLLKLYFEKLANNNTGGGGASNAINIDVFNWSALRFLIGEISYGGRVTDSYDQLLLNIYTNLSFNAKVVTESMYKLCGEGLSPFYIPRDSQIDDVEGIKKFLKEQLPKDDDPSAFGQHFNADVSSRIQRVTKILFNLVTLNPQKVSRVAESGSNANLQNVDFQTPEVFVKNRITSLLGESKNGLPEVINLSLAKHGTSSALNTVLIQESNRYNKLLIMIKKSLKDLLLAINGDIVMNSQLETIFKDLHNGRVPLKWSGFYKSVKNLASWIRDLQKRVNQMKKWAEEGVPPRVFWLGGFIFPSGFLTALKQTYARKNSVSVDQLQFEYIMMGSEGITMSPQEGAYIKGFLLEGAGWDEENQELKEPKSMELLLELPIIWFKPSIQKKRKAASGMLADHRYECPVYYYPKRGTESFVCKVDLKCGENEKEHWIKRGTAVLLSDSQ